MKFPVVLTVDQDGMYTAEVPVIPGFISSGQSKEQALQHRRRYPTLPRLPRRGRLEPPA